MNETHTSRPVVRSRLPWKVKMVAILGLVSLWASAAEVGRAATKVTVVKTLHGGLQPQAVVDARGTVHLIYFKGKAAAGDLFYVRREAEKQDFSDPIQVNSKPGSAIAVGTIRGGQLAVGKAGRVHVAWNGSGEVKEGSGSPMLYARLNDSGTAFEEQRNLMHGTSILDGGGSVAADDSGNVYVAWHALKTGDEPGEERRKVWVVRSVDEGKSFSKEAPAWAESTGACGCCSMRAFADRMGSVYLLYRSANAGVNRDMYLLSSTDKGKSFRGVVIHKWNVATCPMSSMTIVEGPNGVVAAWETAGQIHHATIKPGTSDFSQPQSAPGPGKAAKHPAVAVNTQGKTILVWTEGTGWQKGGALAWQVLDTTGKPTAEKGRMEGGIPTWGLPAVVATDEGFTIIH